MTADQFKSKLEKLRDDVFQGNSFSAAHALELLDHLLEGVESAAKVVEEKAEAADKVVKKAAEAIKK